MIVARTSRTTDSTVRLPEKQAFQDPCEFKHLGGGRAEAGRRTAFSHRPAGQGLSCGAVRTLRLIPLLSLLPLLACSTVYRSLRWNTPDDTILHYTFESRHEVDTDLVRLPAGVDASEVAALQQRLTGARYELQGALEKFKAQYFDDGTSGVVLRLESLTGGQRTDEGLVPLDTEGLMGKSVALRTFDSGELFETLGFEHFSGFGRHGELFVDLFTLFNGLLPNEVPEPGKPKFVRSTRPVRYDTFTQVEQVLQLTFERIEGDPVPCLVGEACVQLRYAGTVREEGLGKDPAHYTAMEGEGTLSGTMLFALDRGDFQQHDYDLAMERSFVIYEAPFDPDEGERGSVRAEIHQVHDTHTSVRRTP